MMLRFFVLFPYDVTQLSLFLRFFIWATEVSRRKSSLRTVLVWQILSFILHSLFYKFLSGSFSWKSGHLSLVTVDNVLSSWLVNLSCWRFEKKIILCCTNLLMMKAVKFWCEGSFQVLIEENDVTWSRRVKSLSLGRLTSPAYFKKTQASKLGDAQGIPFFIYKLSGPL